MEIIIDNDLASFSAGAVISCVYLALMADVILRSLRKHIDIGTFPVFLFLSSVSALMLIVSGMVCYRALYSSLPVDLALSMMIMMVRDTGRNRLQEKLPLALVACSLFLVSMANSVMRSVCAVRNARCDFSVWIPHVLSAAIAVYCLTRAVREFSDLKGFISGMNAASYTSLAVDFNFLSVFLSVILASLSADVLPEVIRNVLLLFCSAVLVVMHVFMYRRLILKHVFIFYDGYEKRFQQASFQTDGNRGKTDHESGYTETYRRLNTFFEDRKPYLDGDLTIADVAKELYTNKLYVSQAISRCSGKNFCQYVNYHRVKYSVGLFKSDPHLKVSQLAEMSGFHTVASFNMAFKLNLGESPSEWCRRQRFFKDSKVEPDDGAV